MTVESKGILYRISRFHFPKWLPKPSVSDGIQFFGLIVAIVSVRILYVQINENTKANKVAIRGQLYQDEATMATDEATDPSHKFNTLWALVPTTVKDEQYGATLLHLLTNDTEALHSRSAAELYHSMFDASVFADSTRKESTADLRRLFLFTQSNFYHVHNGFDYTEDGILSKEEWKTWNGIIREMHVHPVLLAVIWQGYRLHYFSRPFARFLQKETCSDTVPDDVTDPAEYIRGRQFVHYFYPEMTKADWPEALPDYSHN